MNTNYGCCSPSNIKEGHVRPALTLVALIDVDTRRLWDGARAGAGVRGTRKSKELDNIYLYSSREALSDLHKIQLQVTKILLALETENGIIWCSFLIWWNYRYRGIVTNWTVWKIQKSIHQPATISQSPTNRTHIKRTSDLLLLTRIPFQTIHKSILSFIKAGESVKRLGTHNLVLIALKGHELFEPTLLRWMFQLAVGKPLHRQSTKPRRFQTVHHSHARPRLL